MHSRRGELNSPAHDTDKFPNIRSFIPNQKPKKQNHLPQKKRVRSEQTLRTQ